MRLVIDTSQPMTPTDVAILRTLLDSRQPLDPEHNKVAVKQDPERPAPKKSEPKEEQGEYTLDQVIDLATDLVNQGQRDKVRQALDEVGVDRVSSLETQDQIDQFGKALQ